MGMSGKEQLLDEYFSRCSDSKTTCRIYRAAYRRFRTQVPVSAWTDTETVLRYRGLLKKSLQGVFGVMYGKLHAEAASLEVPCVDPKVLRHQPAFPYVIAKNIERLSIRSSYPVLANLRWEDVRIVGEQIYMGRTELSVIQEEWLGEIKLYFWGETTPEPSAPILALSRATRTTPLTPELVEAVIKDADRTDIFVTESAFAYESYRKMAALGVSVLEYEELINRLKNLCDLPSKQRAQGRKTLAEASTALSNGDLAEFSRLMHYAERGVYEARNLSMQESLAKIMAKKSLLPDKPPGMALSDDLG